MVRRHVERRRIPIRSSRRSRIPQHGLAVLSRYCFHQSSIERHMNTHLVATMPCRSMVRQLTIVTLLGGSLFIAHQAKASDYFWNAPASGTFTAPGSWNPSGVPGAADNANFNLGSTGYEVTLPTGAGTVA